MICDLVKNVVQAFEVNDPATFQTQPGTRDIITLGTGIKTGVNAGGNTTNGCGGRRGGAKRSGVSTGGVRVTATYCKKYYILVLYANVKL